MMLRGMSRSHSESYGRSVFVTFSKSEVEVVRSTIADALHTKLLIIGHGCVYVLGSYSACGVQIIAMANYAFRNNQATRAA